ncbi:terminase TerL endonuclease subunit [uncultured Martelella sp.]|uniref:terminase TerL endonuclease subunit n=1 Tax=uncultured Martelella sp. TaxID=392331 RepID=UPI0029C85E35|nr:terminase TerL endonuclease subunit [uncultured Martelella sp.]
MSRFIHKAEWDRCNAASDLASLKGRECYGGLDLSGSRDLTAFVLVFPKESGFDVLCRFFMPEAHIAERSNEDRVPYDLWARQGHITLIPGSTIDPGFVAHAIMEAAQEYDLKAVAYDRWRIEDLKRELALFGGSIPLEPFGQGFKDMSPAVDTLERHVAERMLAHAGNPVLNMWAANAVVTRDPAGSRKLDKSKATGRIDGLVALAMALQVSGRHEPEALPACLAELMV